MIKIKILELFGGIGACTQAFKRLNIPVDVVDYVEIDKYAVKSYNAINGTNFEPQDITKWDKDVEVDFIMHGSPCQDFSVAGLGKGGDEGSETRSSLLYETVRIVDKLRPRYVLWENVKNVLSKKHRHNFDKYLAKMENMGYTNYYQVLNAKDYNIPQNRERVFVLSMLNKTGFEFPAKIERTRNLSDMLEDVVDEKFYISNEKSEKLISQLKNGKKGCNPTKLYASSAALSSREHRCFGWHNQETNTLFSRDYKDPQVVTVPDKSCVDGCSPSLNCVGGGGLEPKILEDFYANREPRVYDDCPTQRADRQGLKVISDYRIRKLTPKECWRLMGFTDESFEKAEQVNSNSQLYKQAGNSIVVNVLIGIISQLMIAKSKWLDELLGGA